MNQKITHLLPLVFFFLSTIAYAQICGTPGLDGPFDIGGQVNTYYPPAFNTTLLAGATSTMLAAVPADVVFNGGINTYSANHKSIEVGDLLLIIQMQDATINSSNSNLYGDGTDISGPDKLGGTGYTDLGNTGLFEYVVATNDVPLTGGTLTFRGAGVGGGAVNTYNNQDFNPLSTTQGQRTFQIVRVPQYSNVKLIANISAPPFNGKVGGIIAFDVAGTMNFNGKTINADARGFRAGFVYTHTTPSYCDKSDYVALSTNTDYKTSGKGEGIVGSALNMWDGFNQVINNAEGLPNGSFGRGAPGNAGGGGNAHNAGGGGGGNGGGGGTGGTGYHGICSDTTSSASAGGRPGSPTGTPTPTRLFMGGGGGAGEVNNATHGNSGGVGGGIILLNVGSISGTGTITANGGAGQSAGWCVSFDTGCSIYDGAGGGGAGGTVYLKVTSPNAAASLNINVIGGVGGNAATQVDPHGPGGGGGGGLIFYTGGAAGTINTSLAGGANGTATDGIGGVHGAASGQAGQALTFTITDLPSYLQGGGLLCYPELTTLLREAKAGSTGTRPDGAPVTYTMTISNKTGIGNAAGVMADILLSPEIIYQSATITYTEGSAGGVTASINQGSSNRLLFGDFTVASGGTVIITILAKVDCYAPNETYNTSAQAYYLDPTRTLKNPYGDITPISYSFTPTSTNPVSTFYETGPSVAGSNYNGLSQTNEDVTVYTYLPPLISSNSPICAGDTLAITSTSISPGISYQWTGPNQFSSDSKDILINQAIPSMSGTYTLSTPSSNLCNPNPVISTSLHVNIGPKPNISIEKNLVISQSSSKQLIASASYEGPISFKWTPSTYLNDDTILNPTVIHPKSNIIYKLTATTPYGCSVESETSITVPLKIPNVLTPNGDGIEDNWEIEGIDNYPNCFIQVFNRLGALIFLSNGYPQAWDGTFHGLNLPAATYYYVIDLKDGSPLLSGYVTIIK